MILRPLLKINVLGFSIHSFHFFGVLGFILGTLLGTCLCYYLHLSVAIILLMSLTGAATFFILAILAKIITGREKIVYYHHEIAILLICSVILRILQLPVLPYIDVTILGIATFLAFGRIGCFSVGCCHGKPCNRGVVYSDEHVKKGFTIYYQGIPLLPVQLIESLFVFMFVISGTVLLLAFDVPAGTLITLYTAVYGAFRFTIEFFRGDPERHYFAGLSAAQWTSLLLIVVSVFMAFKGILPLYNWHIIISVLVFLASTIAILRDNGSDKLTSPRHIRQIAISLLEAERYELPLIDLDSPAQPVKIFETKLGLSLSKGTLNQPGTVINHYTICAKENGPLTYSIASKIAIVIQQLQKHKVPFEIYERQQSVFQILFKQ